MGCDRQREARKKSLRHEADRTMEAVERINEGKQEVAVVTQERQNSAPRAHAEELRMTRERQDSASNMERRKTLVTRERQPSTSNITKRRTLAIPDTRVPRVPLPGTKPLELVGTCVDCGCEVR